MTESSLAGHGIDARGSVFRNLTTPALYMHALRNEEGVLAHGGPLVVDTGKHTGRSAQDKFFAREAGSEDRIWWSATNQPLDEDRFDALREKIAAYLGERDLYVVDAFAGADPAHRIRVRVVTTVAFHALFARLMFITPSDEDLEGFEPQALILHAPGFEADPDEDGVRSSTVIALHATRREVLIGGTFYAGEIKKSVFTLLNDALPLEGVFPMHCSANVGLDGEVAIFFGLSGTGKTTLSADPERQLIGDDEHGWGDTGVFNFEGGCYAKVIRLSAEAEPEIFKTTRTFGTLLENVVVDDRGRLDLDNAEKTENTRAAYKLERISNALPTKRAGHPTSIVFLTADAFGIMPPLARLTSEQARYHFLSGFTAKLAGTEIGVTEPAPTFSPCFGGPFLPQPPAVYAELLGEKLRVHRPRVWLVNTGWTGGSAGHGGHRMPIQATRALLHAALSGSLDHAEYRVDDVFGFEVPLHVPGVETELLDPRSTWSDGAAYDAQAQALASLFRENFEKFDNVDPAVAAAGPGVVLSPNK
ncbi:MAG TPA: phosphoenolpyruvate carboxykinase (ATP) [Gaiellaceae bacterium]|nr:phosphoenolpyruvate carboxykinase (ATP) [Gaiellaceae bacterium]